MTYLHNFVAVVLCLSFCIWTYGVMIRAKSYGVISLYNTAPDVELYYNSMCKVSIPELGMDFPNVVLEKVRAEQLNYL